MKVILLAPTPPPAGGIAGWTARMQKASLKNNWKVGIVDEKVIGGREVFGSKNKKQLIIEIKRSLNIWRQLIKALKDEDAKIVHSCIPASTTGMVREYICAIIAKVWRRKFIIHYRCTLPNMIKSKLGLLMFRILTNKSDLAIVLNSPSEEFVRKYSKTSVCLIPNFIEKDVVIDEDTKVISEKVERVLYIGGVIEEKGCCDIIKVAENFPGIQFRLVGNPEKEILDMIKPPNVVLLGEKNKLEVQQELEKADIFIFVTYFPGEGFSNALVEAMANGLPCIVTDWAANKDMIEDKGGVVVPIKNIESVITALKKLSYDKRLRKEQSDWNIVKVKNHYIDDIITDMYVDSYESILKNKK